MNEELNSIYEKTRLLLFQSEPITHQIQKITHPQLKPKLLEVIRNCQTDLLILNDIIIEAMNCESESELESILESGGN